MASLAASAAREGAVLGFGGVAAGDEDCERNHQRERHEPAEDEPGALPDAALRREDKDEPGERDRFERDRQADENEAQDEHVRPNLLAGLALRSACIVGTPSVAMLSRVQPSGPSTRSVPGAVSGSGGGGWRCHRDGSRSARGRRTLIIGGLQVLAAGGVLAGNRLARWFAVAVVGLSAIDQMFFIPAYPILVPDDHRGGRGRAARGVRSWQRKTWPPSSCSRNGCGCGEFR